MSPAARPLLSVDWSRFDPWRIQPVEHRLMDHPLLAWSELVALGERLEAVGRVRTHSNTATAGTPFNHAPAEHPNPRGARETLSRIDDAAAWMSLLNVQTDDVHRALVDEVLDEMQPEVDRVDPGMCYRGGWIFVSSPRTVTPFHIDKEHNFIAQVRGRKRIHVWDHRDESVVTPEARDAFHAKHSRDLIVWREEFRRSAVVFDVEPGMGAYMPSGSPHMVENLDEGSVTVSFTYYTHATRKRELLHQLSYRLRSRGLPALSVGTRPLQDDALHLLAAGVRDGRDALKGWLGRPVPVRPGAYARASRA